MKEECRGCFLMRFILYENIYEKKYIEEQISCKQDKLDCPCKTCLVKITCDMTEYSLECQYYIDFNIKYPHNKFWEKEAEKRNANKI